MAKVTPSSSEARFLVNVERACEPESKVISRFAKESSEYFEFYQNLTRMALVLNLVIFVCSMVHCALGVISGDLGLSFFCWPVLCWSIYAASSASRLILKRRIKRRHASAIAIFINSLQSRWAPTPKEQRAISFWIDVNK